MSWKRRTQHWHDPGLCCGLVVTLQQLQSNRKNVTLTVKGTVWRLSKYDCPRTEKTDLTCAFMTRYVSVALMYLHLHSVLTEHSECFRLEETNSRLYKGLFCALYFKFRPKSNLQSFLLCIIVASIVLFNIKHFEATVVIWYDKNKIEMNYPGMPVSGDKLQGQKCFLGVRQQQCEPLDHSDNQPNKRLETGVNSCLANNHDFKASM